MSKETKTENVCNKTKDYLIKRRNFHESQSPKIANFEEFNFLKISSLKVKRLFWQGLFFTRVCVTVVITCYFFDLQSELVICG